MVNAKGESMILYIMIQLNRVLSMYELPIIPPLINKKMDEMDDGSFYTYFTQQFGGI